MLGGQTTTTVSSSLCGNEHETGTSNQEVLTILNFRAAASVIFVNTRLL